MTTTLSKPYIKKKAIAHCLACKVVLTKRSSAIHASSEECGVTTRWSICERCAFRTIKEPLFAQLVDSEVSKLRGSMSA